ncbi:heme oxygenase [Flavobacterium chryseum]|uniref:biliverdin-producing heme oxygenase n=1 Tax=Flavobacterium sp. P3160 TaxID=2512113 RepID=UPI0010DA842E|nr:biliverdin-producing heme oxygenase [Flavobacterium sp. P3160]TDO82990.1 heme oxygenase [Flavobacterium sp. P3160]
MNFSISTDFLNKLKTHTAASHKRLEELPVSSYILSPNMKMDDYAHYLQLMYDVHYSVETTVFPLLSTIIDDVNERAKKDLIEADLLYLNYPKPVARPVFSTQYITIPFALGILYVVEGSSLGGRFILKNLETIDGLTDGKGVSYFQDMGIKRGVIGKLSYICLPHTKKSIMLKMK